MVGWGTAAWRTELNVTVSELPGSRKATVDGRAAASADGDEDPAESATGSASVVQAVLEMGPAGSVERGLPDSVQKHLRDEECAVPAQRGRC